MELTDLMSALETAVADVADKKRTLDTAQGALQSAVSKAKAVVDAASTDYQTAMQTARSLRQQLDASLNTSLPADDGRVRQG